MEDCQQEAFHVAQAAQVAKGLTTSPDRQTRRLFNDLPLAFPEIFRVQFALDQRDRQRLFCREVSQAYQRINGSVSQ